MSSFKKKNGYVLLPTLDPDDSSSKHEFEKTKTKPPDLKPGLFVNFSKDRRMDRLGHASESEDIEMSEMKPRRPKHRRLKSPKSPSSKRPHQGYVEEPVLEGDTIQRIALRYSCPVAELRRLNKLYSDLDLHALKNIKIPVKEHGVLSEPLEREKRRNLVAGDGGMGAHSSGGNSTDEVLFGGSRMYYTSDDDNVSHDADDEYGDDSDAPEFRDISIQSALKWKHSRQTLLQRLDQDLEKARTAIENQKSNMQEVRLIFDMPSIHPISVQEYTKRVFDLPDWRVLTGISLVVFVLILLGVVVYYKWYGSAH